MKKIITLCLTLLMVFSIGITAFAVGDSNVDSGGGGMGSGTSTNVWSPGRDGVRVTIIRDSDGAVMTTPIDFSDETNSDVQAHFGKVSKIQYLNGTSLTPYTTTYTSIQPSATMPVIIDSSGNNNIDAIRTYFCKEGTIQDIANITGFGYSELISGEYKILLEPIAYFKFEGVMYAMTATEAAYLNLATSNLLRSKMVSLTHKNLPLSMFLETSDLGLPAYTGSTTTAQTDQIIIAYLGMGIIRFTELPTVESPSNQVTYRTDTEVITSVVISSNSEKSPESPAYVKFTINGQTYTHSNIYLPSGGSQLAWVKWTTPSDAQTITIQVSSNCTVSASTITATIEDMSENEPPDPQANDRNDSFTTPSVPSSSNVTSLSWGEWDTWWYEYWVDNGSWRSSSWTDSDGVTHTSTYWVSNWVDEGWYVYEWDTYTATLSVNMNISPDSQVPTATSSTMKSGYGFNMAVTSNVSSNAPTSDYTGMQNVIAYFPEFGYQTYWRLLDRLGSGYSISHAFKVNQYSTYGQRVHFTPVWVRP